MGGDIGGRATGNRLGDAVALLADGRFVATGGQGTAFQDGADGIGRIRVFELLFADTSDNNGAVWSQMGQDLEGSFNDNFGSSVALSSNGMVVAGGEYFDGMTLVIGAQQTNSAGVPPGYMRCLTL